MSNQILIRVTWWYSLEASSEASSNPVRRALEFVDKEQVFMQFFYVWEIFADKSLLRMEFAEPAKFYCRIL